MRSDEDGVQRQRFQSAVAHELISNAVQGKPRFFMSYMFQSAVAHELISNPARAAASKGGCSSFKALSRMSSFPTLGSCSNSLGSSSFQSAVAHELISNKRAPRRHASTPCTSFKALSRMSSFPTSLRRTVAALTAGFQSAVAHELISNDRFDGFCVPQKPLFQSAVAHELISNTRPPRRTS